MTHGRSSTLSDNARRTLEARYLRRDAAGELIESPAELFWRVARAVASAETLYDADAARADHWARRFHDRMAGGEFLPNSPTLMNAGRHPGVLSACFVLPVEDSVEAIFDSVKHAAQIQKAGGGTGFSFDRLRPTGDYIASSGGRTSGPMSFWRVFAEATRAIQQGAFRRGANMGMLSLTHPDILKFVTAKDDPEAFENFNISVKATRQFMKTLRQRPEAPHAVVNPRDGRSYWLPGGLDIRRYSLTDLVDARNPPPADAWTTGRLWRLVLESAWATGEPGVCFIDAVNDANPTPGLGAIEATNPCGEQPLLDYEACNLGSVDVSKFVVDGRLDEPALRQAVRDGVRFLDDVIDVNDYVIAPIERICKSNRKIGLGIMGLADALFQLGIRYDSDAGLAFGAHLAEVFTAQAYAASEELAHERGTFPNWSQSVWAARNRPMRNAAVATVAPTGTLSILAGCTGGVEPAFALAFYRHILGGQEMLEVNRVFRLFAQQRGFWSESLARELAAGRPLSEMAGVPAQARELFVTAHEIAPCWHVRMQGAFQAHVDGAISKTINLSAGATVEDVDAVYQQAYDLGCKGVTVYRDGCRPRQPMTRQPYASLCPRCQEPLGQAQGCSRCSRCGMAVCL